jgi:hypothetical protein
VFAGGATLDGALAVIDPGRALETDGLDLLGALVGRSLVRTTDNAGRTRFSMLETIREYALEQLIESGERDAICARHANFFASIADQARQVLVVRDRDAQLEALDLEMPNFRGAFDWIIASNQVDLATRMTVGLKDFWRTRSHLTEGIKLVARVLDEVSFGPEEMAQADILGAGAELANWKADYVLAQRWTAEQLAILERHDDKGRLALAYSNTAWANVSTNAEVARDYFYRAVSGAREANALAVLLGAEQGLAIALVRTGDLDEARAAALRAIEVGEQIGDRYTNMFNLLTLGYVELTVGSESIAARRFSDGLESAIAADADVGLVTALDSTAFLLFHRDDLLQAARLAQTAERIRVAIGGAPSLELIGFGRVVDRVRERDAIAFDAAAAESPQMTKDEAIVTARSALEAIGAEDAA